MAEGQKPPALEVRPLGPVAKVFAWSASLSLAALPFIGTVDTPEAAAWLDWARPSGIGPAPGAATAGQADLLVVVGRISHKLAPPLMRLHAQMAHPAWVVHLPMRAPGPEPAGYASVTDIRDVLPVDVVIHGCPPSEAALARGLAVLADRVRAASGAAA